MTLLRRVGAALVGLLLAALLPAAASAHTKSETHSVWRIAGATVHLSFTIPDIEAKRLVKRGEAKPSDLELGAYIASRVGVMEGKRPCAHTPPRSVAAAPTFNSIELTFTCPTGKDMKLYSHAFFDIVPTHVTFANIVTSNGDFVAQLFNRDTQELSASATGSSPLQNASFFQYISMGMMHIFTGIDHMSFILGFIIISKRLKDLLFVITGFTIGHSITLALAVTGLIRPHAEFIDALIGLTIALIGAENVEVASGRPQTVAISVLVLMFGLGFAGLFGLSGLPPLLVFGGGIFAASYIMLSGSLRDAARIRLMVTLVFGLIHGFGFAANLLDERLPKGRLAELLVGFNIGVEIGQVTVVMVVLGVVFLATKLRIAPPRRLVLDVVSACLVGFGLFLFVSRGYA